VYDDATVEAVRRFQERHGLQGDGIIGQATQRALAVPTAWRIRQIEMALERLRWLPDFGGGRLVAVNIPMFRLWAWDAVPSDDPPSLEMAVVVGRALDHRTPVFAGEMRQVIFRPYWNIPRSIVQAEILPASRHHPGYLTREHLEIVLGTGDDGKVLAETPENVALLASGRARLRQRPGPTNALGLVKFLLPNDNDVYLHDTPETVLFKRARRDFSHGCIRVEAPAALAAWVLKDQPGWSLDAVRSAMDGPATRAVDLPVPITVVIFYTTAIVEPRLGDVHFADDLYGQDTALDRALSKDARP
jgi:murein L,D-transpeptidase YcbB/YkuD